MADRKRLNECELRSAVLLIGMPGSGVVLYSTCDVVVHSKAQTDTMTICILDDNQRHVPWVYALRVNCEWKWSFGELIEIFLQTTTIDSFSLLWGSLPDYSTMYSGTGGFLVTQMHTSMIRCNAVFCK